MLSGDFYGRNMKQYIAQKKAQYERKQKEEAERLKREKEWQAKKASVAQEIQTALAEREKRRGNDKGDHRAIVMIDMKDIQDRTSSSSKGNRQGVGDIAGLMDELETTLSGLGFRVISKRSIGRSLEEQALFNSLSGQSHNSVELQAPAYRVEAKVFQYGVGEQKKKEAASGRSRGRMIAVASETNVKVGRVEFSLNFVNVRTGETECAIPRIGREVSEKSKTETVVGKGGNAIKKSGNDDSLVKEKILAQATKEAFQAVAKRVAVALKPFRVVECSDDGRIMLDAVLPDMKQGETMQMYAIGKKGGRRGQLTPVARVRVCEVRDGLCEVEFESIDRTDCGWNVVVKPIIGSEDMGQGADSAKKKK